MTWIGWMTSMAYFSIFMVILLLSIGYIYGKRKSVTGLGFWDCIDNAMGYSPDLPRTICSLLFVSFAITFLATCFFIFVSDVNLIEPVSISINKLTKKDNVYSYTSDNYTYKTIDEKRTISFIDDELQSNKYNYYDTVEATYEPAEISFIEALVGTFNGFRRKEILFKPSKLSIIKHTEVVDIQGALKTSVNDDKLVYKIGSYTLYGKDEKGVIDSLANSAEVDLKIEYDSSSNNITKYKILSAETI